MIGQASIWGAIKDEVDNGIWRLVGVGTPTALSGAGFAGPYSTYTDSASGDSYRNFGTAPVPVWVKAGGSILIAIGTIVPADIIGTAAGQFGHAQGYPLVLAPGAGKALVLHNAVASSIFGVAAYTAGGNVTVNWGAGGAALTGLIAAANFAGNAASKPVAFYPLATAGVALIANAGINLVSASAFTNPGTATGVINFAVTYHVVTL